MPAPFVVDLCGFRDGRASTSDKNDKASVELGEVFFAKLGVPPEKPDVKSVDKHWAKAMVEDLSVKLAGSAPHLTVSAERSLLEFEQYGHLDALKKLTGDSIDGIMPALTALELSLLEHQGEEIGPLALALRAAIEDADSRRRSLVDLLGDESPLRLDLAVQRPLIPAAPSTAPHLVAGLSLKWSLRTDRLQDPRTQGAKMASMRRGRMPHFAAVTMEPRPYMLARLGQGTGDLDCVYHLALPALIASVEETCNSKARQRSRDTFMRMVDQRRVRDYDDLVAYLGTL